MSETSTNGQTTPVDAALAHELHPVRHEADSDREFAEAGDPETWPAWTDEVWTATEDPQAAAREHLDHTGLLTLDQLIDRQAAFYESWRNAGGSFLADELRALAFKVRLTCAATVAEYRERVGELETDARASWEAAGYLSGLAAGRGERASTGTFGHDA
jgi:hypothetical protein